MYIIDLCYKTIIFYRRVKEVVLLLSGRLNASISILGNYRTCEDNGGFPCNNGKCISKYRICNSRDDCGDNTDESRTDGAFCGMLHNFVPITRIVRLTS